jgi:hypothetical protein
MGVELPPFDLSFPTLDDFRKVFVREGIAIIDDEAGLGFLSFRWKEGYLAYVSVNPHEAYLPLEYFDDTEFFDRTRFDNAFRLALEKLRATLGSPAGESVFTYAHRSLGQHYHYCWWQLKNCRLVLAQDERDIQFGLDLSVRFIYANGPIELLTTASV